MASGLFIVVVLIFVLRGIFLGLSGVIGRLLGFVLAYYLAYNYRTDAARLIDQTTALTLPPMVLEMLCGVAIFICTMIVTGLMVSLLFKLTAKIIPAFKQLADKKSGPAMIAGALVNGSLGAVIFLMVMWGVGVISNKNTSDSPLQAFANKFGNNVFAFINDNSDSHFDINNLSITKFSQTTQSVSVPATSRSSGSATITSSTNPEKTLSIESVEQTIMKTATDQGFKLDPSVLMANEQIQSMLNNPEIRNTLMEQLQNNPEKVQQLLENPQLQELLKNYQASPATQ